MLFNIGKFNKIKFILILILFFINFIIISNKLEAQAINSNYGLGFYNYDYFCYGLNNGFTIAPQINSPFSFLINPAYGVNLANNDFSFLISGFSKYLAINSYYSFATLYGNVTLFLNYLNNYGLTPNNSIFFKTNFSKLINEDFWVGIAINLISDGFTNLGFGIDFGVSSRNYYEEFNGFNFKNFSWQLVLNNIGVPAKNNNMIYPPIGLMGGIAFDFLNLNNNLILTFSDNLYLNFYPFSISNGSSVNFNILKYVNLNFGIKLSYLDMLSVFSYHTSISILIPIDQKNNILISYGFSGDSNSNKLHTITANYTFGGIDKDPPKIELRIDKKKFSPNYDGNKDEINIFPKFEDKSVIFGWKIIIEDKDGNIVKTFEGEDVRKIKYVTFDKILQRLFSKKEQVKIPEFIAWDGTDNQGKVLPDGNYYIYAICWDENENVNKSSKIEVIIDTKINNFNIKETTEYDMFSPNGDGRKDEYYVKIEFDNFDDDEFIDIIIKDENDNIIKSYKLSKNDINSKNNLIFKWDGKNEKNNLVQEGKYKIIFKVEDEAGNFKLLDEKIVSLIINYEIIVSNISYNYLSPNGDGFFDTVEIFNKISSSENILGWELNVRDEKGNIVYLLKGRGNIPEKFIFEGKDKDGKKLIDGKYIYQISANFKSGNNPVSNKIEFIIDTESPVIDIREEYLSFSPDGDGVKDTLKVTVNIKGQDNYEVIKSIYVIDPYKQNKVLNELNFIKINDNIVEFIFDGKDSKGNDIPQGNYIFSIIVEDNAGNKAYYFSKEIRLVRTVEEVTVDSNLVYYSPNGDNFNDTITFKPDASDKKGIVKTTFFVVNEKKEIILTKEFKELPQNIIVNEKLNDGKYYYFIKVEYDSGIISKSIDTKYFICDLTPPNVKVILESRYFSPNGDGIKDTLPINFNFNEDILKYEIQIKKDSNFVSSIKVDKVSDIFILNANNLKDGEYSLVMNFYDFAGNKTVIEDKIYINREGPRVNVSTNDIMIISPNFDNFKDSINFNINIDDENIINKDKFRGVNIYVKNNKNEDLIIKKYTDKINNYIFDAIIEGKKTLETGTYSLIFEVYYESGVKSIYEIPNVIVDLEAPKIDTIVKPDLFSPDNDGFNDELYITFNIKDNIKLSECLIQIYRVYENNQLSKNPFKTFTYKNLTSDRFSIIEKWDGTGDIPLFKVDSAADYKIFFYAKDFAGNEIKISQDFTVDILVEKIEKDGKIMYRIILNSITFPLNSDKLNKNSFAILDKLVEKLNKFKDYKIRIIGYTDNTGDYQYNIQLSLKRAKSVYDYLVKKDIDPKRLTYEGRGPNDPIDTNDTEEGRRRNRRVEFYLER